MSEFNKKLFEEASTQFAHAYHDFWRLMTSPDSFFRSIDESSKTFFQASIFGAFVSAILFFINTVSYKINKIDLQLHFILLESLFTWLLTIMYGLATFLICKIFRGTGGVIKTVSAVFYSSVILVFIKPFELPTRIIRDRYLANGPLTNGVKLAIWEEIKSTPHALFYEGVVAVLYFAFFFLLVKAVRTIHTFGWLRAILTNIFGFFILAILVSKLQEPITNLLLLSFKQ